ncbi:MAG: CPBP family intramembrane metalloprotease [Planctomycetaceae bacterium]|nr:CPBP family intramembrane metalloprotease [Planctomycetaceae bacterium]
MLGLLSEISGNLPDEVGTGLLVASFIALGICFVGISLCLRWLLPLFKGQAGRVPVCFRQTAPSDPKSTPPSPPVLLAGLWIAFQLINTLINDLLPQPAHASLPDLDVLITNAVLLFGIGGFLVLLWVISPESGKFIDYFRVKHWKTELQAGAELMLLVMPWTLLLGLISSLWKTPEDVHPLLQSLKEGGIDLQIGIAVTAVLVAPLVEEFLFRVLLLNGLINQRQLSRVSAWIIVSVCFALAHGFANALQLLPLSLALGWCLICRQSYLAIVVAHALFNGTMLIIALISLWS